MSAAAKEHVNHDRPVMHSLSGTAESKTPTRPVNKANVFCYRCGEDGHLKRDCTNEEKSQKSEPATHQNETVVRKLLRGSVEERPEAPGKTRSTKCKRVKVEPAVLPSGLVGPSSVLPIQVEGIYAKALLDSGSQVTLLYRSFYEKYLKHLPLIPIENLEIWGLSMQRYPYDGCCL